jgi:hypothetical protein
MPMPKPTPTESQEVFIERFVTDPAMMDEHPSEEQRLAVAISQWEEKKADDDKITDFPNNGDNKTISLRNSKFSQFDYNYANNIRENYKNVWKKGDNEFGDQAFINWGRVRDRATADYTKSDKEWIVRRERFIERHKANKDIAGIVAVMKWGGIVENGIKYMKDLMSEEKKNDKGVEMAKQVQKNLGILQKAQIVDEEKRIIRVKASDGGYDRDNDRIDPEKWKMPGYNPPLVDSHQTGDTADRRLGEIVRGFHQDGFYWNDIQLDKPSGDASEWTNGEKLANRIWKNAKEGKDIRFSVGFLADPDSMIRNSKGGIDFAGQEQTELSVVLMPSNARAGNKKMGDYVDMDKSLNCMLEDIIKEMYDEDKQIRVCEIFLDKFVYNVWGRTGEEYIDKYYIAGYAITGDTVEMLGQAKEVEPMRAFREKLFAQVNVKFDEEKIKKIVTEAVKDINITIEKQQNDNIKQKEEKNEVENVVKEIDVSSIVKKLLNKKYNK